MNGKARISGGPNGLCGKGEGMSMVKESRVSKSPDENVGSGSESGLSEVRRRELADFLRTRRERLKPDQVGLNGSPRRRTPGLRREEVAELAGVGTTWYTWLEQARDIQPSSDVLARLGRALRLNGVEMRHLFVLAGKVPLSSVDPSVDTAGEISPGVFRLIHEVIQAPAFVLNRYWDILDWNRFAKELFPVVETLPPERKNWICFALCHQNIRPEGIQEWERNARRVVEEFRASLAEAVDEPRAIELIRYLQQNSPEFARWWTEHNVRETQPVVLDLSAIGKQGLVYERSLLNNMDDGNSKIVVFTPVRAGG
jgi:transcriptional regulator with XRE-family HTH domain